MANVFANFSTGSLDIIFSKIFDPSILRYPNKLFRDSKGIVLKRDAFISLKKKSHPFLMKKHGKVIYEDA